MKWARNLVLIVAGLALSGCATVPTGPSVMVLPAEYKPFDVFQSEDLECRGWAAQQSGYPVDAVNQNLAAGAAFGTILGAGLGAAIGAASGHAGTGAAIGAASGLIGGTAVASGPAYGAGWEVQRRYDNAYLQCMYSRNLFRRTGIISCGEYLRLHRRAHLGAITRPRPAHLLLQVSAAIELGDRSRDGSVRG
jgi:hypothetical protein